MVFCSLIDNKASDHEQSSEKDDRLRNFSKHKICGDGCTERTEQADQGHGYGLNIFQTPHIHGLTDQRTSEADAKKRKDGVFWNCKGCTAHSCIDGSEDPGSKIRDSHHWDQVKMLACFSSENVIESKKAAADYDQCHDKRTSKGCDIVNTDDGNSDQADKNANQRPKGSGFPVKEIEEDHDHDRLHIRECGHGKCLGAHSETFRP